MARKNRIGLFGATRKRILPLALVSSLVVLAMVAPNSAFANEEVFRDFATKPHTYLELGLKGVEASDYEVYIGAPGQEKLWEKVARSSSPTNRDYRYYVPDGQYTTRVKIVATSRLARWDYFTTNGSLEGGRYDAAYPRNAALDGKHEAYSGDAADIRDDSATIQGAELDIRQEGKGVCKDPRILYSERPDFGERFALAGSSASGSGGLDGFEAHLEGLKPGTTYYYQAACAIDAGDQGAIEAYGEVRRFTTASSPVEDAPGSNEQTPQAGGEAPAADAAKKLVTGISPFTSTGSREVVLNRYTGFSDEPILKCGLELSRSKDLNDLVVCEATRRGETTFDVALDDLKMDTDYYFRSFIETDEGTYFGDVSSLRTADYAR